MAEINSLLTVPCSCGLPHELIYGPEEAIFDNPTTVEVNKQTEQGSFEMKCIKEIKVTKIEIDELIKDLSSNSSFSHKKIKLKKGITKKRTRQSRYRSCKKKLKNVIGSKKSNYNKITRRRYGKSQLTQGSEKSKKVGKRTGNQSCRRKLKEKENEKDEPLRTD